MAWVVREGARTLVADRTPASAYSGLACPVTLVSPERSPVAARTVVRRLGEAIPGARVVPVPGAGHMAPLTHPELVQGIVLAALGNREEGNPA